MDPTVCNVIYVDQRVKDDRQVRRDSIAPQIPTIYDQQDDLSSYLERVTEDPEVSKNIQALLSVFSHVHICNSSASFVSKVFELDEHSVSKNLMPTIALIDVPFTEHIRDLSYSRPPSPLSTRHDSGISPELNDELMYGLPLLQHIASEIQKQHLSKLVVPIAIASSHDRRWISSNTSKSAFSTSEEISLASDVTRVNTPGVNSTTDQCRLSRYLDAGAMDLLMSPISKDRVTTLGVLAYRAYKEVAKDQSAFLAMRRGRKRSWVGVDEEKPYAYLREQMVSGLMDGICNPQNIDEPLERGKIRIQPHRFDVIAKAVGTWQFSAHDFTDDELLHGALLMLEHALTMPDVERWRIPTENLANFLIASRTAYNSFVPYHNFRHVVDVLQAVFYFLLQLRVLPPYPITSSPEPLEPRSPIASLLQPFDALTLLITAIGHDVGHPGVNNAFLVSLNAPLAQLYNDRSVLESFHCAAFSQVLRRHWPAAFMSSNMRKLLINSILATDMGLHFDYMKRLGYLQEKLNHNSEVDEWDVKLREEHRTLVCSLLIKCADISNVARVYDVAAKWATILTDEFARQASMEEDLGIPSTLFAPPIRDSILELARSQIGFMNLFALPLFQGVTDIMPDMRFSVDQLHANKDVWAKKIEVETEKRRSKNEGAWDSHEDDVLSPTDGGSAASSIVRQSTSAPAEPSYDPSELPIPGSGVASRETSGTVTHLVMAPSPSSGRSRRSSPAPPNRLGQTSDIASRRSSGAFTGACTPPQTRRSSNTVPSQLQLGITYPPEGTYPHTDPSLVTVVVTSPGISPRSSDSKSAIPAKHESGYSERGSVPSAGDRCSQGTNATNRLPHSPSTEATSFLSLDSSARSDSDRPRTSPPSFADGKDSGELKNRPGVTTDTVKTLRQRPSRSKFRLTWWKSKKRPPVPSSP